MEKCKRANFVCVPSVLAVELLLMFVTGYSFYPLLFSSLPVQIANAVTSLDTRTVHPKSVEKFR